ncbi:MAG TPA: EI24 domain-containing protein [Microcoleaceae cyanobacterium]|jgi:CysZ protein
MNQEPESETIKTFVTAPISFVAGALYPLRVLSLLQQAPQLWAGIVVPILVNVVVGIILYASLLIPGWRAIAQGTASIPIWLATQIARSPEWLSRWLTWIPSVATVFDELLQGLLALLLLVMTGFLLVQFGAILGAPWYGMVAEQIEKERLGELPVMGSPSLGRIVHDIWRAIAFQLKKLLLLVVIGIPLLLLNFFPPIGNVIASVGSVALAALMVVLDFIDPPLERRRLRFRTKIGMLIRTIPASVSFALVCLGLMSIPFLNLIMVPVCVMAGTLFSCDRILPKLKPTLTKDSFPS